jgi:hypothetical protein
VWETRIAVRFVPSDVEEKVIRISVGVPQSEIRDDDELPF